MFQFLTPEAPVAVTVSASVGISDVQTKAKLVCPKEATQLNTWASILTENWDVVKNKIAKAPWANQYTQKTSETKQEEENG